MPLALPATPRKMFPPPTTTAIWTPVAAASATSSATSLILCVSIPEDSDPSNASPLSLRSTLLYSESPALTQPPPLLNRTPTDEPGPQPPPKKGDTAVSPWGPLCFLSELVTNEPADFYVLPNARDHLAAQLINRLIRVFDKGLFKQHHLFQPLVQLALGDLLNHMIWLARLPRLRRVDVPLSFDFRFWNIYARHPLWRRSGNVHGKIVDKTLKLIVTGDEVRLTVDLQQHTYLPTLMHIRVNQSFVG